MGKYKSKKLHWVSIPVEVGELLERHRLEGENDAEFCRKMIRRFINERPKLDRQPSETQLPAEYRFWDEKSIIDDLGGVSLHDAIAAAATLDPLTPITSADELLADLKCSYGLGLVPIVEAFKSVQYRVGMRGEKSPGRKMISELRSDRKIALRRLKGPAKTIDGVEYTHLEILADVQVPAIANKKLRELTGGSQKKKKEAFSMPPTRIEGSKGLTLGYWLSSKYLKKEKPDASIALDNLTQHEIFSQYADLIRLLRLEPCNTVEFKFNRASYRIAGPGSLDIYRILKID